ncbi:hypothetical protein PVAP13_7KG190855 [Panicum virgatum]|uniref:Uncharacterized protein n=1 Tax=Panicum virgatum TaxID=38727 RepID=A0A8T0QF06_PANVG|nr:hypothetical protein PVAP13_7KG190855 [Panicum virgatum]
MDSFLSPVPRGLLPFGSSISKTPCPRAPPPPRYSSPTPRPCLTRPCANPPPPSPCLATAYRCTSSATPSTISTAPAPDDSWRARDLRAAAAVAARMRRRSGSASRTWGSGTAPPAALQGCFCILVGRGETPAWW